MLERHCNYIVVLYDDIMTSKHDSGAAYHNDLAFLDKKTKFAQMSTSIQVSVSNMDVFHCHSQVKITIFQRTLISRQWGTTCTWDSGATMTKSQIFNCTKNIAIKSFTRLVWIILNLLYYIQKQVWWNKWNITGKFVFEVRMTVLSQLFYHYLLFVEW